MTKALTVAVLSYKDVLHEWRMSLCVMFAVAAIATPLLLFFGLKSGIMDTLRQRLLNNPSTMELMSVNEKRYDAGWFEEQRKDPLVSFVIPKTRRLSASAEFQLKSSKNRKSLDLLPTAAGDPLLAHYHIVAPKQDECVLTAEAAKRTGAHTGDIMEVRVSRDRGSVKAVRELKVAGILPESAGVTAAAYIDLVSLEQIESFKDGMAVPELNWPGAENKAYPVTPKALVVVDNALDAVREAMLTQNTGFAVSLKVDDGKKIGRMHPLLPENRVVYAVSTVGTPASRDDLDILSDRVRGRQQALVLPYNPYLTLTVNDRDLGISSLTAVGRALPRNFIKNNAVSPDVSIKKNDSGEMSRSVLKETSGASGEKKTPENDASVLKNKASFDKVSPDKVPAAEKESPDKAENISLMKPDSPAKPEGSSGNTVLNSSQTVSGSGESADGFHSPASDIKEMSPSEKGGDAPEHDFQNSDAYKNKTAVNPEFTGDIAGKGDDDMAQVLDNDGPVLTEPAKEDKRPVEPAVKTDNTPAGTTSDASDDEDEDKSRLFQDDFIIDDGDAIIEDIFEDDVREKTGEQGISLSTAGRNDSATGNLYLDMVSGGVEEEEEELASPGDISRSLNSNQDLFSDAVCVLQDGGSAASGGAGSRRGKKQEGFCAMTDVPAARVFYVSPKLLGELYPQYKGEGEPAEYTVRIPVTVTYINTDRKDEEVISRSVDFTAEFRVLPELGDDTGSVLAAPALLGQLGLLQLREIVDGRTSDGKDAFMLKRRGYTGFRMYARDLEHVITLQDKLTEKGIKTVSRADRISEILSLDRYLALLFWLIASASLLGAACCLIANVYANVERKRKELAILRLLGVHGTELCVYPLGCSLMLTLGGVLISFAVYGVLSYIVNRCFAFQLQSGEKFCHLQFIHFMCTLAIAVSIATVSGLIASRKVLKIEPSESLRDE